MTPVRDELVVDYFGITHDGFIEVKVLVGLGLWSGSSLLISVDSYDDEVEGDDGGGGDFHIKGFKHGICP